MARLNCAGLAAETIGRAAAANVIAAQARRPRRRRFTVATPRESGIPTPSGIEQPRPPRAPYLNDRISSTAGQGRGRFNDETDVLADMPDVKPLATASVGQV